MARLLIAEDECDIRDLIAFTLRYSGHQVITTTNGEEALEKTRTEKPDLVIMDVRMPRMTGYEACRLMKTDQSIQHIPVVFLSAKGQEAEIKMGMEAGAIEYILKPFSPDHLVEKIEQILKQEKG
jgi:DNA-binding response OmpR family regulator